MKNQDNNSSGSSSVRKEQKTTTTLTGSDEDDYIDGDSANSGASACKIRELGSTLRVGVANGSLKLEPENTDLVVDLVESLMIDRLHLKPTSDKLQKGEVKVVVQPLLNELDTLTKNCMQVEESQGIQTELCQLADYTKNLMQQFGMANELNDYEQQSTTSKNLLKEVNMMLKYGAQNAAKAYNLNNRSRSELSRKMDELKGKISFLTGDK